GDQVLMGEAANQESLASDARGPAKAAQNARLLYRRLAEMYPNSPLAPEAAWRAADIQWQLQKADAASRPSAKEKEAYLHDQMDEEEMKKLIKGFPNTRQAALAAFALIDNKLCGDWQGQTKCPEKESEYYEKYAADGSDNKSSAAHNHARDLAARLKEKFPQSDFTWRAAALVYKLDEGIPVYGNDRE